MTSFPPQLSPEAISSFRLQIELAVQNPIAQSNKQAGRGIVVWAGGAHNFTGAWVQIKCLRELGCQLPIQFWHAGDEVPNGIDEEMRALVLPLGVECIDATQVIGSAAVPKNSQQRKLCTIVHCKFLEVLLLDPHNLPIKNPEYLFEDADYQSAGGLFWQGIRQDPPDPDYWDLLGLPYRPEPEIDLGQILVHKGLRWDCPALAWWLQGKRNFSRVKSSAISTPHPLTRLGEASSDLPGIGVERHCCIR